MVILWNFLYSLSCISFGQPIGIWEVLAHTCLTPRGEQEYKAQNGRSPLMEDDQELNTTLDERGHLALHWWIKSKTTFVGGQPSMTDKTRVHSGCLFPPSKYSPWRIVCCKGFNHILHGYEIWIWNFLTFPDYRKPKYQITIEGAALLPSSLSL